jgi:hypothetical protein
MKRSLRLILLIVGGMFAALVAARAALDWWLESPGGRRMLEKQLERRLGMRVDLGSGFEVSLLPDLRVAGPGFVLGGPECASALLCAQAFELAVAPWPLLRRRVQVDSIRLEGGNVRLDRRDEMPRAAPAAADSAPTLPRVDELVIRDLLVLADGEGREPVLIRELRLEGFAPHASTRFRLALEGPDVLQGAFVWDPDRRSLEAGALWAGRLPGAVELETEIRLDLLSGTISAQWAPGADRPDLELRADYAVRDGQVDLQGVQLSSGAWLIQGAGCLFAEPPSIHLRLEAQRVDLEALKKFAELVPSGDGGDELPDVQFRLRLDAEEILWGDTRAEQASLTYGDEPDCDPADLSRLR